MSNANKNLSNLQLFVIMTNHKVLLAESSQHCLCQSMLGFCPTTTKKKLKELKVIYGFKESYDFFFVTILFEQSEIINTEEIIRFYYQSLLRVRVCVCVCVCV